MIKLFSPRNEAELAVARSLLESEGIPYHIKNEHFGSLYPGISIKYINAKTVYVPDIYEQDALDVLYNLLKEENDEDNVVSIKENISVKKNRNIFSRFKEVICGIFKIGAG